MSQQTTSGGIGFLGAMGIVFITLKLTDNIDWSWVWVTAPMWGGVALAAAIVTVALLVIGIGTAIRFIFDPMRHSRGRKDRGRW